MERLLKRNFVLPVSFILVVIYIALDHLGTYELCGRVYGTCMHSLHNVFIIFTPILPLFVFALITYFMREEVYKAWIRFAIPMLGISMLLTAIMPDSQGGGFGPQISFGKPDIALLASAIFVIVSIIIIVKKYLQLRK